MHQAFDQRLEQLRAAGAQTLLCSPGQHNAPGPQLLQVEAPRCVANAHLRDEVFGPVSLVVWCARFCAPSACRTRLRGSLRKMGGLVE